MKGLYVCCDVYFVSIDRREDGIESVDFGLLSIYYINCGCCFNSSKYSASTLKKKGEYLDELEQFKLRTLQEN